MEIAKVDLRGVVLCGVGWEAARAAVTASMVAHGCCVVVAPDALGGADLYRALFSRAVRELFALPLEVKQRTMSTKGRFKGYVGQIPGIPLESLGIMGDATDAATVQGFTETLWPEGNPEFCETVVSFAKNILKLEEMVQTLVLEGLGVRGEGIAAHFDLLTHSFRMSHYGAPADTESGMTLPAHRDDIMLTAIVQHGVEGLEVNVGDGRWVAMPHETGTVTLIAGSQFTVVTNGRVPACHHRVRTPSNRERFSVLFSRLQKDGVAVRALEDLVDAEHPLIYTPLRHEEYSKWRSSEEGLKFEDPLKAYYELEEKVQAMLAA